ncbi:MAG: metallophosphoesterase [Candidatus Riflebacteria bacterium]|nr:metallophosphoesterase [Candidatus Riflebacteria bacterium]
MIMIISDVHGRFNVVNEQVSFAENSLKKSIECILVLGDLGLFEVNLRRFFEKEKQTFCRPLYFIEGNHEEFSTFDKLLALNKSNFTHLARGSVQRISGYNFLCIGGAKYMDATNTPRASEITEKDIENCLNHEKKHVDIIISHDCPIKIGVPNTPGLEFYGPPGFTGSERVLEHFSPQLWFFGHHHKWFEKTTTETRFFGLPETWKGFILLDENYNVEIVKNVIENKKKSFWERFF